MLSGALCHRVPLGYASPMTETTIPARFAAAPRAKSHGGFIHTCNGDVLSGLPFGRKNPDECARCWDMVENKATARADHAPRRRNRAAEDAELSAAIRAHDCKVSGCSIVCTAFDY